MLSAAQRLRHRNPVYSRYFADPFAWKSGDSYFAIGTGYLEATGRTEGNIFPVLHSRDFLKWDFVGNALEPPDARLGTHFWAPEVAVMDGRFYLYYSVGFDDKNHQLRVAVSDEPQGPYRDTGETLVDPRHCPFAIDPHPFQDDDGQWYLFYARDFLNTDSGARVGTGLVARRMRTMTQLDAEEILILRARSDWQRFQAQRTMYGGLWDWHTLEGPFVRKRDGRYFCFYSGGRWETDTYGVDYGIADNVLGPYSDSGNECGPRVLRTTHGKIIGPGHNSIVTGPDDAEYLVFHAWDAEMKARRMFIDPLNWTSRGPVCEGPTLAGEEG